MDNLEKITEYYDDGYIAFIYYVDKKGIKQGKREIYAAKDSCAVKYGFGNIKDYEYNLKNGMRHGEFIVYCTLDFNLIGKIKERGFNRQNNRFGEFVKYHEDLYQF